MICSVAVRLRLLVLALVLVSAVAEAGEGTLYVATGTTESKPQSKLWYHDGSWWGIFLNGGDHLIHQLDGHEMVPVPNGFVDSRNSAQADVLWTGEYLFVLMGHKSESRFYKFTYDSVLRIYQRETGFPVVLPLDGGWGEANLAQDTNGTVWVTYVDNGDVRMLWSVSPDHELWDTAGFTIGSGVGGDLSAIVAFDDRVGVMWGNQNTVEFLFRVHGDGAAETDWDTVETVASGGGIADDHINLAVTPDNRILAATKDRHDRIHIFLRSTTGTWESQQVAPDGTRPIVVYDKDNANVYVFYTNWSGADRKIVYKKAPIGSLSTIGSFPETDFLVATGTDINNVTSTKQAVGDATGLLAAAKGGGLVHFKVLAFTLPTADASASVTEGVAPLVVTFIGSGTDPDGTIVSYAWDFGDGTSSTQQSPEHTYTDPGVYVATLTVTDNAGNTDEDTVAINVTSGDEPVPGGVLASINFQPSGAVVPSGYVPASGATFTTSRGYGWTASVRTKERGSNPDQRLDTYAYVSNKASATWEYALENGQYFVTLVAGSPAFSGIHYVSLEGTSVIDGVSTSRSFVSVTDELVTVSDGKLSMTIGGSGGSKNTKICYLIISMTADTSGNLPPTATATPSVTSGLLPLTVDFTGSGTDPDGTIVSYAWDFDDGTISTLQNPSHTYTAAGIYNGLLTVTDDGGRTASDAFTITVTAPAPPPPPPGTVIAKINFQPSGAVVPSEYLADSGKLFTDTRGYGWNASVRTKSRGRNPDQRLDTYIYVSNTASAGWEYALANGQYTVTLVAGSPAFTGIHHVSVEGTMVINGVATKRSFVSVEDHVVTVADGKLTITIGGSGGSKKTKICYVIIKSIG